MNKYYVYFHKIPKTGEIFYIGKGCSNRAYDKKSRNKYWINIVNKYGLEVEIKKNLLSEELAFMYEKYFIRTISPKCNMTTGGEGGSGWKFFTKEEKDIMRKKCSQASTIFWKSLTKEERLEQNKKSIEKARIGSKKKWAAMCTLEKSREQKRRSLMRKSKKVKCLNNGIVYKSINEAAKKLNLKSPSCIRDVLEKGYRQYKGYKFIYATSD